MNFEEWREANPFAWYPGCGRTQAEHLFLVDQLLTVLQRIDIEGKEPVLASLSAEIPGGFCGPHPVEAIQGLAILKVDDKLRLVEEAAAQLKEAISAAISAGAIEHKRAKWLVQRSLSGIARAA